jgi:hypothetical protein
MDPGYTIVDAATANTPRFGITLSRLGNFDGDVGNTDDFAIGVPSYPFDGAMGYQKRGRVAIVRGAADSRTPGASQSTITLPDAARTIVIDGEPGLNTAAFGNAMVGLGRYYSDGLGTTLVVGAPGDGYASSPGRIYAYRWLSAAGGTLGASSAQILTTAAGDQGLRFVTELANLGSRGGALPLLAIANTVDNSTVPGGFAGTVFVQDGDATSGPFGGRTVVYNVAALNIGRVIFGGAPSGTNASLSIVGGSEDRVPDFATAGANSALFIMSGANLPTGSAPVQITEGADVAVPMPDGWKGPSQHGGGLIPDVNGDGMADFMTVEGANGVGRVLVLW